MARPHVYQHDLRCPHCGSNWTPKDGHSRGKQTYRCGDCHYRFTPSGNRHYYSPAVKRQAVDMYAEGTGLTAIGRVLGVQTATVFSWVKVFLGQKSPPIWGADATTGGRAAGPPPGCALGPGDFI